MYYPAQPYPTQYLPFYQPVYRHPTCRYYLPQQYIPNPRQQQYPEVDPTIFYKSAEEFKKLMKNASFILNKLAEDKEFAHKVMKGAQQNEFDKVEQLIESTGVKGDVDVSYNPDGINIKLSSEVEETECCKLEMAIRWR